MNIKCEVKLTTKDMYGFLMYHSYHSFQGIFSIVIGILILGLAGFTYGNVELTYSVMYLVFGIVFLVYIPGNLYMRAKKQIMSSEVLKNTLQYTFSEKGVKTEQGKANAEIKWENLTKLVFTKNTIFVYSSKAHAFIIPKATLGAEYGNVVALAKEKMPANRCKLK